MTDIHTVHPPAHSITRPPVIVLHELFGVTNHVHDVCAVIAAAGHPVAAPNLYASLGQAEPLDEDDTGRDRGFALLSQLTMSDTHQAIRRATVALDSASAYLVGLSVGGYLALRASCRTTTTASDGLRIERTVAIYPGWIDSPDNPLGDGVRLLDHLGGLTCPALAITGTEDSLIRSTSPSVFDERAASASHGRLQTIRYPGCLHGYLAPHRASHDPAAARATMKQILAWLQ